MEIQTIKLEEFSVIGFGIDCLDEDISGIEPLWEKKFFPRFNEISGCQGIWGVCLDNGNPNGFYYMACCKVAENTTVPEGMELRKIPQHCYAVHPYKGLPTDMASHWQRVNKQVLPQAGFTLKLDGPWLEMYPDNCYDEKTGEITCDLYSPIAG